MALLDRKWSAACHCKRFGTNIRRKHGRTMSKRGWILTGQNAGLSIIEVVASPKEDDYERLSTYSDAKAEAIKQLNDHIQPYLNRLEELQNDAFAQSGKLPALQGWFRHNSGRIVVTATTKKRAIELVKLSRYEIETHWRKCDGNWWHHLACEEGVWCEERGENGSGNGVFFRPIELEEANEIAVRHLNKYQAMPIDRLISLLGQECVENGKSSMGTPYRFKARISISGRETKEICVTGNVDASLAWKSRGWASIKRKLPIPQAVDWVMEGF